jgi:hypothetical protein
MAKLENLKFSRGACGFQIRVVGRDVDVSEAHSAFIFRVEEKAGQEEGSIRFASLRGAVRESVPGPTNRLK